MLVTIQAQQDIYTTMLSCLGHYNRSSLFTYLLCYSILQPALHTSRQFCVKK